MRVDRARAGVALGRERAEGEVLARQHPAGGRHQLGEQLELGGRQRQCAPVDPREVAGAIDRQRSERDHLGGLDARRRGAAQDGAHAGDQLARRERLGHVVVAADLEPDDLVELLVARRQEHDRHLGPRADTAAHLEAVELGHRHVEHDERERPALLEDLERRLAVGGDVDRVSLAHEGVRDDVTKVRIVVDHQDPAHRSIGRGRHGRVKRRRRAAPRGRRAARSAAPGPGGGRRLPRRRRTAAPRAPRGARRGRRRARRARARCAPGAR